MHIMYVDEAGDPGFDSKSSQRYVRVGVIVHGWKWADVDERLTAFKLTRGLQWSDEIRASDIRRGTCAFAGKPPAERDVFLTDLLDTIGREFTSVSALGVCINKLRVDPTRKERLSNPAVRSHELLLEEYDRFLSAQKDRCGIVVLDENEARHDANLRYFQNYLRHFSERIDARRIVEGALFLKSHTCNLLQLADVCANVFYQRFRWRDETTRQFARIEGRFVSLREWPEVRA
ncbi:hypothetical protein RAS1_22590 [Phycisphaerae bacterium RAS1]|nr:hypothetical protein RAS1_22590 [Phycisphaerae bacterium RAS1]